MGRGSARECFVVCFIVHLCIYGSDHAIIHTYINHHKPNSPDTQGGQSQPEPDEGEGAAAAAAPVSGRDSARSSRAASPTRAEPRKTRSNRGGVASMAVVEEGA